MKRLNALVPKRVFTVEELEPGEKLFEVSVSLRDAPGAIAKVAEVLSDANVNIKTGSTFHTLDDPKKSIWTTFIDVSEAKRSLTELERELRKLDVVTDVTFMESKPAPFETLHFPLLHGKSRAVILSAGTMWTMWDGLEKILLPSGFAVVQYNAGKKTGEHAALRLKETYGLESTNLILGLAQALKATGWGITEAQDINFKELSGTVIVKECFEAVAWRKKHFSVCHWTRGFIAGALSVVFGKQVEAVEARCLATGDEHCEFKIQPSMQERLK